MPKFQCGKNLGQLEIRALRNSPKGFTMIELMITIGIFAMITGAVLANFRGGERAEELRNAAENVKSILNEVRNMTLTGQVRTYQGIVAGGGSVGLSTRNDTPMGGYGIVLAYDTPTQRYQYRVIAINAVPGTTAYQQGAMAVWSVGIPQGLTLQPTLERFALPISLTFLPDTFSMITFEPLTGNMVFRNGGGAIVDISSGTITATHTALPPEQKRSVLLERVSGRISAE